MSRAGPAFLGSRDLMVLVSGINVAGSVPMPLLGGLLIYLGAVMLVEALLRAPAQRSITDLMLAVAILLGIVWFGYLQGVMLGLIGACLTFAFNYSRIGVVKRHLTRADFASNVERSPEQAGFLPARASGSMRSGSRGSSSSAPPTACSSGYAGRSTSSLSHRSGSSCWTSPGCPAPTPQRC